MTDHSGHFFLLVISLCLPSFPLKFILIFAELSLPCKKCIFLFDFKMLAVSEILALPMKITSVLNKVSPCLILDLFSEYLT